MLQPRIIPSLLIQNNGLVKTVKFSSPKYIGDPLNAVRIFNEKKVDELFIFDIDKTSKQEPPNYSLIKKLARECRMPICYGGGIKDSEQVEKIINLGIEKACISSAAIENPKLIENSSKRVGSQSVVVCLDIKKTGLLKNKYSIFTHNGSLKRELDPISFIAQMESLGAGEILINMIDKEGTLEGYDLYFIEKVKQKINIPLSVLGGASCYNDFSRLISKFGLIGCCAGTIFVLKGKYRAVLIQYPNSEEKEMIIKSSIFKN